MSGANIDEAIITFIDLGIGSTPRPIHQRLAKGVTFHRTCLARQPRAGTTPLTIRFWRVSQSPVGILCSAICALECCFGLSTVQLRLRLHCQGLAQLSATLLHLIAGIDKSLFGVLQCCVGFLACLSGRFQDRLRPCNLCPNTPTPLDFPTLLCPATLGL